MGETRNTYSFSVERPEGKNCVEDLGVDGNIMMMMMIKLCVK
jgi:hypothetical protein